MVWFEKKKYTSDVGLQLPNAMKFTINEFAIDLLFSCRTPYDLTNLALTDCFLAELPMIYRVIGFGQNLT